VNEFAVQSSHGTVSEVAMYSIMENPMTACGCFECIAMLIPEANGVMIVSREEARSSCQRMGVLNGSFGCLLS
jgi:acetyl-CoA synthase